MSMNSRIESNLNANDSRQIIHNKASNANYDLNRQCIHAIKNKSSKEILDNNINTGNKIAFCNESTFKEAEMNKNIPEKELFNKSISEKTSHTQNISDTCRKFIDEVFNRRSLLKFNNDNNENYSNIKTIEKSKTIVN